MGSPDGLAVSPGELVDAVERALGSGGPARLAARALVEAEALGERRSGLALLAAATGADRPPRVERRRAALAHIDARATFGPLALAVAAEACEQAAAEHGVGATVVTGVGAVGRLAPFVVWGAERGYVTLAATDAPAAVAPHGGSSAVLGTNPIAVAVPAREPQVLDFATAAVTQATVRDAAESGDQLPEGAAIAADGAPARDPARVAALLPRGGLVGTLTALLVEALTGAVAGTGPSTEGRTATIVMIEPLVAGATAAWAAELERAFTEAGGRFPGRVTRRRLASIERIVVRPELARLLAGLDPLWGDAPVEAGNGQARAGTARTVG